MKGLMSDGQAGHNAMDVRQDEMSQDLTYLSRDLTAPLDAGESTIGLPDYAPLSSATAVGQQQHVIIDHREQQPLELELERLSPDNVDLDDDGTRGPPVHAGFLVSFMVDARGGAMRGCRHSGVRVIIPPKTAQQPMRITCRYLRKEKLQHPPPLMEGEACASKIMEVGPAGAKFLGPVLIEVPHFASLRGREREIIILRSENGEVWREHLIDQANDDATVASIMSQFNATTNGGSDENFDPVNKTATATSDTANNRLTRIVTTEFPKYFAIITRVRQQVHAVGADGGTVTSDLEPKVQAIFPEGALTKRIKVGLQSKRLKRAASPDGSNKDTSNEKQHETRGHDGPEKDEQEVEEEEEEEEEEEVLIVHDLGQFGDANEQLRSTTPGGTERPQSANAKRRSRFLTCFGVHSGSIELLNEPSASTDHSKQSNHSTVEQQTLPESGERVFVKRHIIGDVGDLGAEPGIHQDQPGATDQPDSLGSSSRMSPLVADDYYIEREPPLILNSEPQTYGKRLKNQSAQTEQRIINATSYQRPRSGRDNKSNNNKSQSSKVKSKNKSIITVLTKKTTASQANSDDTAANLSTQLQDGANNTSGKNDDDQLSIIQDVITSDDQKWRTCTIQTDDGANVIRVGHVALTIDDGYCSENGDLSKQGTLSRAFGRRKTTTSAKANKAKAKANAKAKARAKKAEEKAEKSANKFNRLTDIKSIEVVSSPLSKLKLKSKDKVKDKDKSTVTKKDHQVTLTSDVATEQTDDTSTAESPPVTQQAKLTKQQLKLERQEKQRQEKEAKKLAREKQEAEAKAAKLKSKHDKRKSSSPSPTVVATTTATVRPEDLITSVERPSAPPTAPTAMPESPVDRVLVSNETTATISEPPTTKLAGDDTQAHVSGSPDADHDPADSSITAVKKMIVKRQSSTSSSASSSSTTSLKQQQQQTPLNVIAEEVSGVVKVESTDSTPTKGIVISATGEVQPADDDEIEAEVMIGGYLIRPSISETLDIQDVTQDKDSDETRDWTKEQEKALTEGVKKLDKEAKKRAKDEAKRVAQENKRLAEQAKKAAKEAKKREAREKAEQKMQAKLEAARLKAEKKAQEAAAKVEAKKSKSTPTEVAKDSSITGNETVVVETASKTVGTATSQLLGRQSLGPLGDKKIDDHTEQKISTIEDEPSKQLDASLVIEQIITTTPVVEHSMTTAATTIDEHSIEPLKDQDVNKARRAKSKRSQDSSTLVAEDLSKQASELQSASTEAPASVDELKSAASEKSSSSKKSKKSWTFKTPKVSIDLKKLSKIKQQQQQLTTTEKPKVEDDLSKQQSADVEPQVNQEAHELSKSEAEQQQQQQQQEPIAVVESQTEIKTYQVEVPEAKILDAGTNEVKRTIEVTEVCSTGVFKADDNEQQSKKQRQKAAKKERRAKEDKKAVEEKVQASSAAKGPGFFQRLFASKAKIHASKEPVESKQQQESSRVQKLDDMPTVSEMYFAGPDDDDMILEVNVSSSMLDKAAAAKRAAAASATATASANAASTQQERRVSHEKSAYQFDIEEPISISGPLVTEHDATSATSPTSMTVHDDTTTVTRADDDDATELDVTHTDDLGVCDMSKSKSTTVHNITSDAPQTNDDVTMAPTLSSHDINNQHVSSVGDDDNDDATEMLTSEMGTTPVTETKDKPSGVLSTPLGVVSDSGGHEAQQLASVIGEQASVAAASGSESLKEQKKRMKREAQELKKQAKLEAEEKKRQAKEEAKRAKVAKKQRKQELEASKRLAKEEKKLKELEAKHTKEQLKKQKKERKSSKSSDRASPAKAGTAAATSVSKTVTSTNVVSQESNEPLIIQSAAGAKVGQASSTFTPVVQVTTENDQKAPDTIVVSDGAAVATNDEPAGEQQQETSVNQASADNHQPVNNEPVSESTTRVERTSEEIVGDDGTLTKLTSITETRITTTRREQIEIRERKQYPDGTVEEIVRCLTPEEFEQLQHDRPALSATEQEPRIEHMDITETVTVAEPQVIVTEQQQQQQSASITPAPTEQPMSSKKEWRKKLKELKKARKTAVKEAKIQARHAKAQAKIAQTCAKQAEKIAILAQVESESAVKYSNKVLKKVGKAHKKMDKKDKELARLAKKVDKHNRKLAKAQAKADAKQAKRDAKLAKKQAKQAKEEAKKAAKSNIIQSKADRKNRKSSSTSGSHVTIDQISAPMPLIKSQDSSATSTAIAVKRQSRPSSEKLTTAVQVTHETRTTTTQPTELVHSIELSNEQSSIEQINVEDEPIIDVVGDEPEENEKVEGGAANKTDTTPSDTQRRKFGEQIV
ncbi:Ankyrin-2, partial [Fragariocoptes setiger]